MTVLQPAPGVFSLPPLAYDYSDLEPVIDPETMALHHDKHHGAYVAGLNLAMQSAPLLAGQSLEAVLGNIAAAPPVVQTAIRNMGGGHFNHSFFWQCMSPRHAGPASRSLARVIAAQFGSLDAFQQQFEAAGTRHFGSGWVWLCVNIADPRRLEIVTFTNQDTWVGSHLRGLLTCDVWEHAYSSKYRNRRADWLKQWWQLVDWDSAERRYDEVTEVTSGRSTSA